MDIATIGELAKLFAEHGIYSKNRYSSNQCPLQVFKMKYPHDSYSKEIETFLDFQLELNQGKGADLPWWGNLYFKDEKGIRTMILSQDSRTPNGGSVTFYMPLLKENKSLLEPRSIINNYPNWDPFISFEKAKKFLNRFNFNYDFLYMTDAQKIDNGWEELLEKEIQIAKPDIILYLGNKGLTYLLKKNVPKVTNIVDKKDTRLQIDTKALPLMVKKPILIASLFPSKGNGHYTNEREDNVVNTYIKVIQEFNSKGPY